jgi:hypothetical protein
LQGKKGGWGAAATGFSAALAAVFFVLITVGAELAYLIACSGNNAVTFRLNDLAWACVVIVSFPAAMLIMAGTFGLWWAGLISKRASGRTGSGRTRPAGRTTWARYGFWAPDGAYSRFISPIIARSPRVSTSACVCSTATGR